MVSSLSSFFLGHLECDGRGTHLRGFQPVERLARCVSACISCEFKRGFFKTPNGQATFRGGRTRFARGTALLHIKAHPHHQEISSLQYLGDGCWAASLSGCVALHAWRRLCECAARASRNAAQRRILLSRWLSLFKLHLSKASLLEKGGERTDAVGRDWQVRRAQRAETVINISDRSKPQEGHTILRAKSGSKRALIQFARSDLGGGAERVPSLFQGLGPGVDFQSFQ